jgi:hypothetical protein
MQGIPHRGLVAALPAVHAEGEVSPCRFDECGCVRLSQRHVARIGLRPLDLAVITVYRGIICLWRDGPDPVSDDPDFLVRCEVRVDHYGGVTTPSYLLRRAGLTECGVLAVTAWGNELSIS